MIGTIASLALLGIHGGQLKGTKVIELPDFKDTGRENRLVPINIHRPSDSGTYPLVIFSHGAGGTKDANFAQAKDLASHGYVVACIEHVGSNTNAVRKGLQMRKNLEAMTRSSEEVLGRPKDVTFALNELLKLNKIQGDLYKSFDRNRIGMIGHSFGAFTTLAICGARPALDWLTPSVGSGKGLGPNLRDKRIKCGVALSPQAPGEPFFIADSYKSIAVPMMGVTGTNDQPQTGTPIDRKKSFQLWPPKDKYLVWISNAEHNAFSDSTGSGKRMLNSSSRADVQPLSKEATWRFFDVYLKGDTSSKLMLSQKHLSLFCKGVVSGVEVSQR